MLRVISAPPGTGKTLLMVQQIYEYLNQGYQVYANITGLKIPGVLPAPYDWRDLPNNSVVFYDEAHEHPAFAKEHGLIKQDDETLPQFKKRVNEVLDIGNSLSVHRHFGFHIIFATQDPAEQLDSRLFGFFNEHIHLYRAFNANFATMYFWRKVQRNPDAKSVQKLCEVTSTFRYPKHLYKFYESSSGDHNHKFRLPLKYIAFALIPILLIAKGIANASETSFFGLFGKKQTTEQVADVKTTALTPQNATASATGGQQTTPAATIEQQIQSETARVSFVSKSDTYCRAFDGNGNLMRTLSYQDCVFYSDNPIVLKAAPADVKNRALQAVNYTGATMHQQQGAYISATEKQVFTN